MTIYALSTGPGISGVAIIRISGPDTSEVIKKLTNGKFPKPRVATLKKINNINTSELIDEGLIVWFPGPESYTGEDMAEFHIHGSKAVIEALHNSISKVKNCRIAEPGEFTRIAFQNGKINLLKAESIADLISSETEIQRKQAIEIMKGKSSVIFNELRQNLLKILSHVEAKIDFPDEDLQPKILKDIKSTAIAVHKKIKKILNDEKIGEIIREGFKITIIGPTNVGKSSLLNYLSKRDAAIVSDIEGTTRDIIEVRLNINGFPVIISDTAGIRDAANEIEKKGIKIALKKAEESDLKILVMDAKSVVFEHLFDHLIDENTILVLNKSDLLKKKISSKIKKIDHVLISIKKELNIKELISKIENRLKNKFNLSHDIIITRARHRQHLEECLINLENFNKKNEYKDFDKAAEDLRLATRNLGKIVGKVDVEEILGSIFNDFCIGK